MRALSRAAGTWHARGRQARTAGALAAAACFLVGLAGCVDAPVREAAAPSGFAYYPLPPAAPRIQYLTTFATERDVTRPASDFAQFVLGEESNVSRLRQPYGVALHAGRMYVADGRLPGLAIFDLVARRFEIVSGSGRGRMQRPINVTIDDDGTKYVTDTGRNQILVLDDRDRFVTAYGAPGQFKPVDVEIVGDRLYVADVENHRVHVLDKRTGASVFTFGKAGSEVGELFHPTNLSTGPDGDLYVVDTSNYRVQRFTLDGKPLRTYGAGGDTLGSFARPKGIAIDREGRMYVGDSAFENVQVFDREGRLLLFFGQPNGQARGLSLPTGVAIDYDHVDSFRGYADPRFDVEYVILVASQFGPNKVDVFGFGRYDGADYSARAGTNVEIVATRLP